jgi:hypothetical protein
MRWLHIPPRVTVDAAGESFGLVPLPQAASAADGWLEAIIANHIDASFLLTSTEDTQALVGAMAPLPQYVFPLKVAVCYHITPQELAELASTARSKSLRLRLETGLDHLKYGTSSKVTMADEHLLALVEPVKANGVEELELNGNCKGLTDAGVQEFVKACGATLEKLSLANARRLTDIAMFALHRYCPLLHELTLGGAPFVTVTGVVPLVASAPPPMRTFKFNKTGVNFKALADMLAQLDITDLAVYPISEMHQVLVMDRSCGVERDIVSEDDTESDED